MRGEHQEQESISLPCVHQQRPLCGCAPGQRLDKGLVKFSALGKWVSDTHWTPITSKLDRYREIPSCALQTLKNAWLKIPKTVHALRAGTRCHRQCCSSINTSSISPNTRSCWPLPHRAQSRRQELQWRWKTSFRLLVPVTTIWTTSKQSPGKEKMKKGHVYYLENNTSCAFLKSLNPEQYYKPPQVIQFPISFLCSWSHSQQILQACNPPSWLQHRYSVASV